MLASIYFYYKPASETDKIHYIWTNLLLSPEFQSIQPI